MQKAKLREAEQPEQGHTAGKGRVGLEIQALQGESGGPSSDTLADFPPCLFFSYGKKFFLWNALGGGGVNVISKSEIVTVVIDQVLQRWLGVHRGNF